VTIPDHVADPQVFNVDHVVLPQQDERGLVVEVTPLALNLLMFALQEGNRLAPPTAPFLSARDPTLRSPQRPLSRASGARIGDRVPRRR
jgi:hypothetical protein